MKNDRNAVNHFDIMGSYPSLAVLTETLATLPVTTATNERSFGTLNIGKHICEIQRRKCVKMALHC